MTTANRKPARRAPATGEITDAERRVLLPLAEGLGDKQIGTRLSLTGSTVKSHLVRISQRWGVRGRHAILTAAYQRGELPLPDGPELLALRAAVTRLSAEASINTIPDDAADILLGAAREFQAARDAEDPGHNIDDAYFEEQARHQVKRLIEAGWGSTTPVSAVPTRPDCGHPDCACCRYHSTCRDGCGSCTEPGTGSIADLEAQV